MFKIEARFDCQGLLRVRNPTFFACGRLYALTSLVLLPVKSGDFQQILLTGGGTFLDAKLCPQKGHCVLTQTYATTECKIKFYCSVF